MLVCLLYVPIILSHSLMHTHIKKKNEVQESFCFFVFFITISPCWPFIIIKIRFPWVWLVSQALVYVHDWCSHVKKNNKTAKKKNFKNICIIYRVLLFLKRLYLFYFHFSFQWSWQCFLFVWSTWLFIVSFHENTSCLNWIVCL